MGGTAFRRGGQDTVTDQSDSNRMGPYTAIVVGSGCSVGLGVPALAGFLDTVMDKLAKKNAYTDAGNDLAAIQAFITRVKGAAAYVNADLLNIEELYGMADMDEDLWKAADCPPPEKWYGFKPLISDLDPMRVKKAFNRAIYYLASRAGEEFLTQRNRFPEALEQLEEIKRESATETLLHSNCGSRWTNLLAYLCLASFKDKNDAFPLFIQFNWDLALDRALYLWSKLADKKIGPTKEDKSWLPWYGNECTGNLDYENWPRLARPHGGINWISYEPPRNKQSLPSLQRKAAQQKEDLLKCLCFKLKTEDPDSYAWIDTRAVHHESYETLSGCQRGEFMEIVPPTWRKQATKPAYEAQWGHISQGLQSVRRIIFIGYSLPKTDLYFRHFLALSLADNPHLPKVYVLNPGIQEPGGVQDNYLDLFAPLAREGRLYGIKGRFGDPALFDLHRAIAIAKPITHGKSGLFWL